MARIISLRQFAREKQVNLFAVQQAIQNGRIKTVKDAKGRDKIDADTAGIDWDKNKDLSKVRDEKDLPEENKKNSNFAQARMVKATFEAKLSQLEYERKIGRYVLVDEVKAAAFKAHRTVRDNLLNIPDRIAAQLAAETDPHKTHKLLLDEIYSALGKIINGK